MHRDKATRPVTSSEGAGAMRSSPAASTDRHAVRAAHEIRNAAVPVSMVASMLAHCDDPEIRNLYAEALLQAVDELLGLADALDATAGAET